VFRHIRSKLIAAFAVPLAVVVGVAAFGTFLSVGQLHSTSDETALVSSVAGPTGVVQDLQAERQYALLDILRGTSAAPASVAGLSAARTMLQTDAAVKSFETTLADATGQQRATYANALAALAGLPHARALWAPARASLRPVPDAIGLAQATDQAYSAIVYAFSAATAALPVPLHRNALEAVVLFGLIALIGAVALFVLVARVSASVSRPLVELARQAEELALVALPATVRAILNDKEGKEAPKLPSIDVDAKGEVAEMARAIEAVGKTAVELAAGQATLSRNLAEAFVNLGRRNQNLVTRQLEYISEIELKEADPESLEELFRLDHLATRMRRNAESLLILAGSGPARQWSAAVPAMDVARAASAEVEDYKRLRLHHFDQAQIAGSVTTDLVHILAELIENALSFSPPGSPVDLYGRFLEGGYVIVIVDSGIGMSDADLETANRRLQGEGAGDEVPGRYLGHFVAGRLAARHGIAISLQTSHSGGLVARVKVPAELIDEPVADLSASSEVLSGPPPAPASGRPQGQSATTAAGPSVLPTPPAPASPPPTVAVPPPGQALPGRPAEPTPPRPPVAEPPPAQPPTGPARPLTFTDQKAPATLARTAPDLTILSPLAATEAATDKEPSGLGAQPHLARPPQPEAQPLQAPQPAQAAPPARQWQQAVPVQAPTPAVPPAYTANGSGASTLGSAGGSPSLPKLATRVPGASLPPEDGSLRRETPTTTTRSPLGITAALSQYLSATSNDGRHEKGDSTR
jgi:signal transduction histidine kinase